MERLVRISNAQVWIHSLVWTVVRQNVHSVEQSTGRANDQSTGRLEQREICLAVECVRQRLTGGANERTGREVLWLRDER